MEKQFTNINDDKTRIDTDTQNTQKPQTKTTENKVGEGTETQNKNSSPKSVIVGSLGVIAGVAGALGLSAFRQAPTMDDPNVDTAGHSSSSTIQEPESLENIQLAHTPNDDMSFNAAFAAAREEVGAHGVFEWRGGVYGTYYANEWDNFTDEYKAQFNNHNWRSHLANNPVHAEAHENVPSADTITQFGEHEIRTDENGNQYISLTDAITGAEVRVGSEDIKYAILDEHGELLGIVNEDAIASTYSDDTNIQGHYAFDSEGNFIGFVPNDSDTGNTNLGDEPIIAEEVEFVESDDNVFILNAQNELGEAAFVPDLVDGHEAAIVDDAVDGQYNISVVGDNDNDAFVVLDDKEGYLADNDLPDYANDAPIDEFV